ncbi:MAG TPA: response regulator [Verrucomicrobiae bacterium]|nr:response regulator [Verrucomicrobiae bacterium]
MDAKKCLGASVKFWRNRMGLSQEALAERSNMHRTYICDVERGARNVSLETIERLARALEISTFTLFFSFRKISSGKSGHLIADDMIDILIVEDNPNEGEAALRALKRASLANRIEWVRDGQEALDFLFGDSLPQGRRRELPHLILLDLCLPRVDGLEVLRQIREDPLTRTIPVVALAGSRRGRDVAESQRLGTRACIIKPVDFRNLSEVVPRLNMQWVLKPQATASV